MQGGLLQLCSSVLCNLLKLALLEGLLNICTGAVLEFYWQNLFGKCKYSWAPFGDDLANKRMPSRAQTSVKLTTLGKRVPPFYGEKWVIACLSLFLGECLFYFVWLRLPLLLIVHHSALAAQGAFCICWFVDNNSKHPIRTSQACFWHYDSGRVEVLLDASELWLGCTFGDVNARACTQESLHRGALAVKTCEWIDECLCEYLWGSSERRSLPVESWSASWLRILGRSMGILSCLHVEWCYLLQNFSHIWQQITKGCSWQ